MGYLRIYLIFMILALTSSGCTLPLIWEEPVEVTEPPVIVETSPTATEKLEEASPAEPAGVTGTPLQPEVTLAASPTATAGATKTPAPRPTRTPTPESLPYVLQPGSPVAVPNFSHPELGCDWLGVGGQVFNRQGQPQPSVVIEVGGTLAGIDVNKLVVSGGATIFGEGGYELTISERPIGTDGTLWIQLFDITGKPLSDKVFFNTYNDCSQNLILINFVAIPAQPNGIWLPVIER